MLIHLTLYRDGAERTLDLTLPPAAEAGLGLSDWSGASVSTALQVLQRTLDPQLGYALSCRRGLCKVCAMRIDGEVQTACTVPLHEGIRIAPAKPSLALLDTVVELSLVRSARIASSNSTSLIPEPSPHDA
ncbi:2Fe-2S iron-sulfur cluster-binding protein [Paucibacter sp. R3-3]|uniref:succinate dehydrogenase n=1 Tax=Roseateles agri TaxID=3098619 RepID=A0ABU5DPK8_9BURK|nr:2Fe-2S iron-sulfur cluster-binding protein [Paucibacter sp. R3-3]MDY0747663.1 2Fe-2S iron-sulfur cluster-binding protein [Paucibacter sp. R3-3]